MGQANFAVVGMVSAAGHARTAGVVIATDRPFVRFMSGRREWKVRHIESNPHVSVTVPVPKRVPLLPMIKVPAATITFHGTAPLLDPADAAPDVVKALTGRLELGETAQGMTVVERPASARTASVAVNHRSRRRRQPDRDVMTYAPRSPRPPRRGSAKCRAHARIAR
jgi:hypothetical protein